MEYFCQKLPKVELHAHLNGSLSKDTLTALGCLDKTVAEYQKLTRLFETTPCTLDECFTLFNVAHNATKNTSSVYTATTSVIDEFYKDNCIYLELRTTPRAESDMSKEEYIEAVVKAITNNKNNIVVKLILSIDRRHDFKTSQEALYLIIKMKEKYPDIIKGVDLCGNPNEGVFDKSLFLKAKENGLFVTLHCGEVLNSEEISEMLEFGPDRLGHGTFIKDSCWEKYCLQRIPVECCLTSNIVCGTVATYKEHHVKEWMENNFPFSLGTDDKGIFCTTLSNEYYICQLNFNLTREQLKEVSMSAINQSFASNIEKEQLRKIIENWKYPSISNE